MNEVPVRVQLQRRRGWRMPPNTVVVSRPSKWGNPFRIGDRALWTCKARNICEIVEVTSAETAVMLHREWLQLHLKQHPDIMRPALEQLRGKNLACWCRTGMPCHADTLLEFANREQSR